MHFVLLFILSTGLLVSFPGLAQKISTAQSIKGGVIKTSAGKVLVFNNYHDRGLNFSLTFRKGDVQATERSGLYTVNGMPFQVLAVPVGPFKTDSVFTTLQRYISSEASYFREEIKLDITPFARVGQDKNGLICAIWGFPMPDGSNEQVEQQLFVVFLDGDFIVSVGSSQLKGQQMSEPLDMLLAAAHTYKSSPTAINLKSDR